MASLDGLTSGASARFSFTSPDGTLNFAILQSITAREDAQIDKKVFIDGTVAHPEFHQGWSGTAIFQRGSNVLDNYINLRESNYFLGGDQIDATITYSVNELDGSVSQYQFVGVVLKLEDAGTYSGTDTVQQTVSFMAKRRQTLL